MSTTDLFYVMTSQNGLKTVLYGRTIEDVLARGGLDVRSDTDGEHLLAGSDTTVPLIHRAFYEWAVDGIPGPRIDQHDLGRSAGNDTHVVSYDMSDTPDPATSLSIALMRLVDAVNQFKDDERFATSVGYAETELLENIQEWVEDMPDDPTQVRRIAERGFVWTGEAAQDWTSTVILDGSTEDEIMEALQNAALERFRRTSDYMTRKLTIDAPAPVRPASP